MKITVQIQVFKWPAIKKFVCTLKYDKYKCSQLYEIGHLH